MSICFVDTNLIIRFLTGEPKEAAGRAAELFAAGETDEVTLRITPLVVAEAVFVLSGKVYGYERDRVASSLTSFIESPSLDVEKRHTLLLTLSIYREYSIDFVDAFTAAEARLTGHAVASFDRDFEKIPMLTLRRP